MQKRTLFILGAMMMILLVPAGGTAGSLDAVYVPVGTLSLAPPRGIVPQRAPVAFPHSDHFGYTCRACHHRWDGFAPVKSCATTGCHDQSEPVRNKGAAASATTGLRYYKAAYHQQCIGCHKQLVLERNKREYLKKPLKTSLPIAGPTGCVGCHPKN